MKKLPYFIILLPLATQAETFQAPQPVFFEKNIVPKTEEPQIKTPEKSTALSAPMTFDQDDNTQTKLEKLINYSVVKQQWGILKQTLPLYQSQPQHDVTLYRYALGAMLRAERNHKQAIHLYQQIVDEKPELAYPRFDLGVMLFENKQYRQAKAELERATPALSPAMQQFTQRYLEAMKERQGWKADVEWQYTQTDNVNNASSQQDILLGKLRFKKDKESLPQKAHGFRYGLGLSREINVAGNHFVTLNSRFGGVHYWDNQRLQRKITLRRIGLSSSFRLTIFGIDALF